MVRESMATKSCSVKFVLSSIELEEVDGRVGIGSFGIVRLQVVTVKDLYHVTNEDNLLLSSLFVWCFFKRETVQTCYAIPCYGRYDCLHIFTTNVRQTSGVHGKSMDTVLCAACRSCASFT